jgi:hypothetical protein
MANIGRKLDINTPSVAPARGAGGGAPAAPARPPSTPAAAKNRAGVEANKPDSGLDMKNPRTKEELDAETEAAAGRSPQENQGELAGTNNRTQEQNEASGRQDDGTIGNQDKSPGAQKKRDDTDAAQEKSIKDKLKTPAGIALIAALGLTLALVTMFLAKAGENLKACKEAKITVSKIEPSPVGTGLGRYIPFLSSIVKPKTVDISYTCTTNYQPIAGKESLTFYDTGFPEFDEVAMAVKKVLAKNKIQVECGADDCSDFKGTKGRAEPNCGDFSDYFDKEVQDAAKDTGEFFGNLMKGFADNWSTWLFVILICVGIFFLISALN